MHLISLFCLLVVSSSALGRSTYGGFANRFVQRPLLTPPEVTAYQGYQTQTPPVLPPSTPVLPPTTSYDSSYGTNLAFRNFQRPQAPTLPLSEADILCQGKRPETVIPLGQGERFVVCLDDSKGFEQTCPTDLFYSTQTGRCERKIEMKDPCLLQPCLNGGQCIRTEYSYQCQCLPGYDGKTCELDAQICQTQQPCGQMNGAVCQSFHAGASLKYVCILQDGFSYGLNAQQVHSNPCVREEGPHPLAFTDKGYITCNGENMYIHSCPGGTIWDNYKKSCVWPELVTVEKPQIINTGYGAQTEVLDYGRRVKVPEMPSILISNIPKVPSYGELPKVPKVQGYGEFPKLPEIPKVQGYGEFPKLPEIPKVQGYGEFPKLPEIPKVQGYGEFPKLPKFPEVSSYGGMQKIPDFGRKNIIESVPPTMLQYGQVPRIPDVSRKLPETPEVNAYGGQMPAGIRRIPTMMQ